MTEDDLRAAMGVALATSGSPNTLVISTRTYFRLARSTMTKRQFRRWRGRLRAEWRQARREADPLPDGVWVKDDRLVYDCLSCGQTVPLDCDLHEFDPAVAYCGGSPRCLP